MKFDAQTLAKLKRASLIVVGAVVVAGASYWYGSSSAAPKMVAVSQTGCGAAAAAFGVPLETIARGAPKLAASFGPMEIPAASLVRLHFDPDADGKGREVKLIGDVLHLPVTYGPAGHLPERIRMTCRDGAIATIRYEGSGRSTATFSVVRQEVSMLEPQAE
jgi:hypothetical protein